MTLINMVLLNLFSHIFETDNVFITACDFLAVLSLMRLKAKMDKKLVVASSVLIWSAITIVYGADFSNVIKGKISLNSWIIVLFVMLMRMISEKYNYRQIAIDELEPRMIPSACTVMQFQQSKVQNLPTCMTEDLRARLTVEQVDAIKRWKNSKNGKESIVIVKKIPFAIYISIGTILFLTIALFGFV